MSRQMMKILVSISAACLSLSLFSPCTTIAASSRVSASADPISLIERDFQSGTISFDEKAIYTVRAIRNPAALPLTYQPLATESVPMYVTRDVTLALRDIMVNWNQMSDSAQHIVQNILTRWSAVFTYVSPGGFFRFHYDTTGSRAVPTADTDMDGVPDYVEKCAAYCDSSLNRQLELGYVAPPSDGTAGGDSKYDVYFEAMSYYGYTQPENPGPQTWNDYTSYLVLHRNFIGFPPNTDPEGNQAGAAKVTCAHEFHHAIQFAYNVSQSDWYMELDATAMESMVFPHTNDNYNYLPSFFESPQLSLMDNSIHMYACFPWGLFLAEKFDTSLGVAAWQGGRFNDISSTINDTLLARYGWTEDSAFAEYEVWNYCTGSRDDGLHFRDGANYPLVAIGRSHNSYPVTTQTSPSSPAGYAASYVQFIPNGATGKLRVTFDGDNSRKWAAYVIKSTSNNTHQFQKIKMNQTTYAGAIDVYGLENCVAVTLVGINLTQNSAAANFTYSAQALLPYELASTRVSDSALYSGATRAYKYQIKNPSAIGETVKVIWFDGLGWVVMDSTTKFLSGGDSTTISINIKPPVGTPLGSVSILHLKDICLNDTAVTIDDYMNETTVVYRGDVNFNGIIDLADLSYLVAYISSGGNPPKPVMQSGDFNCAGIVDLADLSALVAFLTGSGSRPPCNPF